MVPGWFSVKYIPNRLYPCRDKSLWIIRSIAYRVCVFRQGHIARNKICHASRTNKMSRGRSYTEYPLEIHLDTMGSQGWLNKNAMSPVYSDSHDRTGTIFRPCYYPQRSFPGNFQDWPGMAQGPIGNIPKAGIDCFTIIKLCLCSRGAWCIYHGNPFTSETTPLY